MVAMRTATTIMASRFLVSHFSGCGIAECLVLDLKNVWILDFVGCGWLLLKMALAVWPLEFLACTFIVVFWNRCFLICNNNLCLSS